MLVLKIFLVLKLVDSEDRAQQVFNLSERILLVLVPTNGGEME